MSDGVLDGLKRLFSKPNGGRERTEEPYRIRLVVGLGNPGPEYTATRHNVGFWTVNRLARKHGIQLSTSSQTALGEGAIAGRTVALAKPRTFVNKSGAAVWNLIKRLKIDDAAELLVVYDDIDMPIGKTRLRPRGGHGGYKGLQSIIQTLGTDAFPRLRIGIGRPVVDGEPSYEPDIVADYVLSEPPPDEREALDEAVARAVEAIEVAICDGLERAMGRLN